MKSKNVAVIGSGFSGLSASTILASQGHEVHVYEKNNTIGGRARQFSADGFKFDMGPSWYWMPDVIEKFYNKFGYTSSDFYDLVKLDPGFKVIFSEDEEISIPENWEELCELFEQIEKGSSKNLEKFMKGAKYKYDIGVNHLVYQPGLSIFELSEQTYLRVCLKWMSFLHLVLMFENTLKIQELFQLWSFLYCF